MSDAAPASIFDILRPYQKEAIGSLREGASKRLRRQLLASPTGSGKTEMAMVLVQECLRKGKRVWFIVDRVTLVDQTSRRFDSHGIEHGVIQANHPLTDPKKLVQIVSVQTLGNRLKGIGAHLLPDLIVWDECHAVYKGALDLIAKAAGARVIGLSATPFTAGMDSQWDGLVNSTTVNKLLAEGFLAPLRIKACVTPDMKDARIRKGEYAEEDAGARGITIIGNVVETWIEQTRIAFGGPVKTIVFSPSVKHGDELRRQFAAAGFNFQQISYLDGDDEDRNRKIAEFRKADSAIHGLISCAVLTKGFDVPDILCGISCRPYRKSFSSHIQEMGRAMRTSKETGKEFALWLDHSGNCLTFEEDTAWLFEYGVDSLSKASKQDSVVREPKERPKTTLFCRECGMQMEAKAEACPACGWEKPRRGEIQIVQGELIDLDVTTRHGFAPRAGLRADCLADPQRMWTAALAFTSTKTRRGAEHARKWAMGIWSDIYPNNKLPRGLYEAPCDPSGVRADEWALIDREVKRFRKHGSRRAA
ncbi:DEAD/DEAH box helicase [Antarcticirhabdus aurantiaca]|uniref:DEAD/DEAH box helicase n=1 Tax=Antarcticirhabdus aurantiaca TaxID=2606717 RepID=UPI00131A6781|nr:DEAD/DEAH box helicase family protein [Antarcticirhabdus aurantiaca]